MSSPKFHTMDSVRQMLADRIENDPTFSLSEFERNLGGSPSRQALKKFVAGEGGGSFWERVGRVLRGEPDVPGLAEEAESALRLIREAEAAMLRVTERIRSLPVDPVSASALRAVDDPIPAERVGREPAKRRRGSAT